MTQTRRPLSLIPVAAANLVVGCAWLAIYLFCGGSQLLLTATLEGVEGKQPAELKALQEYRRALQEHAPLAAAHGVLVYQVGFVTSWMLILSGLGLLALRRWGRTLALAYGVVTIVFQLASLTYLVIDESPRMVEVQRHMDAWAEKQGLPPFKLRNPFVIPDSVLAYNLQAIVLTAIMSSYAPVAMLLMFLPGVRKALAQPPEPPPPVERLPANAGNGEIVY